MKTPPLLRYFGGKYRDSGKIIAQMPPHKVYVEPFGGGASVLLAKEPAPIEVYNDLSGDVVNFFKVLRDRPNELIRLIELTPYSRQEWRESFEKTDDPLEAARRLYVRSWQSHGSGTSQSETGWRFIYQQSSGQDCVRNFNRIAHIWLLSARLKQIQIENDEASNVIKRYARTSDTLIYLDPPYPHSTRTRSKGYEHEMSDRQHEELAQLINSSTGMFMISGYDCELYQDLYRGWTCARWESQVNGNGSKAIECLWLSPSCEANQLPLFRGLA